MTKAALALLTRIGNAHGILTLRLQHGNAALPAGLRDAFDKYTDRDFAEMIARDAAELCMLLADEATDTVAVTCSPGYVAACTGAHDCPATVHTHGCFADRCQTVVPEPEAGL